MRVLLVFTLLFTLNNLNLVNAAPMSTEDREECLSLLGVFTAGLPHAGSSLDKRLARRFNRMLDEDPEQLLLTLALVKGGQYNNGLIDQILSRLAKSIREEIPL